MAKKSDESGATLTEDALTFGAAVVPVVAAAQGQALPTAAALALVAAPFLGRRLYSKAAEALFRRHERRFERLLSDVAATMNFGSPADVEKLIDENIDEPWAHAAITDAARTISQEIDDAAVPALVRLTAIRFEERRAPDEEVKRAIALLLSMNAGDVVTIRAMLTRVRSGWQAPHRSLVILLGDVGSGGSYENSVRVALMTPLTGQQTTSNAELCMWGRGGDENYARVLRLLKLHGFADENQSGLYGAEAGPHAALVRRDAIDFLARLFL